ncbi:MAG: FAD:protein FMN transferase [Clostridiales bacterium]|nr:FAD:protein FMN transferase [Clostridiales bacterium]
MEEKRTLKSKSLYIALIFLFCVFIVFFVFRYISSYERNLQSYACGSIVNIHTYGGLKDYTKDAEEEIKTLDSMLISTTQKDSFVFALNRDKKITDTEGRFTALLSEYMKYSAESEKFSLMCGELKDLWDMEGEGYLPSNDELGKVMPGVNDGNIVIKGDKISLKDGKMDLGALGKGTACQWAIEKLKAEGVSNALVTVGGSVGVTGHPGGKESFTIGIRNPFLGEGSYFATIDITDKYISTSGDYEKYVEIDGKKYCHIFDAQTGRPKEGDVCSVTAIAENGSLSDFLSTAMFLEDEKSAETLAKKYDALYICVKRDKTVLVSKELKGSFTLKDDSFTVEYI